MEKIMLQNWDAPPATCADFPGFFVRGVYADFAETPDSFHRFLWNPVLRIREILVRIRTHGSVPLTNGSGSNSGSDFFLYFDFKNARQNICFHIFLMTCPHANHLHFKKFNFLLQFCVQIIFCMNYFSPLNTFMRKGKDPDPYFWLIDPDPGPITCGSCGSGFPTLVKSNYRFKL